MILSLRRVWHGFLHDGGYLVLLALGPALEAGRIWLFSVAAVMAFSLAAWLLNLRRLRAIADTPTSRVASAAQGFVELIGVGRPLPGASLCSPAHQLPCLWYRYRTSALRDNHWVEVESGESEADFLLDDGSGLCRLRPAQAEVVSARKDSYRRGDYRIVEELLLAGDRLYALGDFVSRSGDHHGFDANREMQAVLGAWKDDQVDLERRFDLDGDGDIDGREWGLARQAARREVDRRRAETEATAVGHALEKPRSLRPYLIANFPPDTLAGRYRLRTWAHALIALASLVGVAAILQHDGRIVGSPAIERAAGTADGKVLRLWTPAPVSLSVPRGRS